MRNDSKISPIPPLKNRVHEFSRMTVVQGAWGPALREKANYTLACFAGSPDPRSRSAVAAGKTLYSDDEVPPLDDTALVTAVSIPSSEAIGNHSTGADDDWTDQIRGIVGG